MERLTRKEMAERYPDSFLGVKNIVEDKNGLVSADVVYTDKPEEELRMMQVKNTGIVCYYTTADRYISLGFAGII